MVLLKRPLHRLCPARTAAAACEVLVLEPVDVADRAKALAASAAGSSMPDKRMDLALHDAVCLCSAKKSLLQLLWRPSVPR